MKKNKLSFLDKAESTLKALEKCKFEVKQYSDGDFYVSCHISAGPIEEKKYAELLAADFDKLVETRMQEIDLAINEARNVIDNVLSTSKDKIRNSITGIANNIAQQKPVVGQSVNAEKFICTDNGMVKV